MAGQNPILRNESREVGFGGGTTRKPGPLGYADPDGTETVEAWECVEGCPVAELDAQSGELTSNAVTKPVERGLGYGGGAGSILAPRAADMGGASRFFPQFPADPAVFRYVAKPSSAEKEEGVGVEARGLAAVAHKRCAACGRQEVNVRGAECRCSSPCWVQPDVARVASNDHPTVKSIALMRWLVDLVTQRGDLVLDPFAGSGTTGVACLASGRRVILVERDPRFAEIARQRCAHWGAEWSALAKVSQRKARAAKGDEVQPSLFGDGSR